MYLTYTRHRIKDYDTWKKAFDENSPMLAANDIRWVIAKVNDDPTDISIVCYCPNKEAWEKFMAAGKEKMEKTGMNPAEHGGVIGEIEGWGGEIA
jgi:hypothetical protein